MGVVDIELLIAPAHWASPFAKYSKWLLVFLIVVPLLEIRFRKRVQRNPSVPIVAVSPGRKLKHARQRFYHDAQTMLLEGYHLYKEKPFYVPTAFGEQLMVPPKYVEELKNATVEHVDFVGTFFRLFEGQYTTMGSRSTLHPRITRLQLNQYIDTVLEPTNDEIVAAFQDEVPVTEDWIDIAMADKLVWIVARASSRMFAGKTLARNKEWLDASLGFAEDGFVGAQKIKACPMIFRPILARMLPELRRIPKYYEVTRSVIRPILESREDESKKENDLLQWMIDDAKGDEQDPNFISDILLKLSFAALHTSAATPMQLMFDLCEHPEYIPSLRAEIEAVLAEQPVLNKRALGKLQKMDSFMKESLRFNPLLLVTFQRIVTCDLTLSDGFTIPAGTQIGSPSQAIAMDPDLYPDPEVFDGYRHEKVRAAVENDPSAVGRTQWASANLENMAFGYGRHACPGRFFAAFEIKFIMVHLLMTYDFRYAEGQAGRPANLTSEIQMIPNHEVKIQMRRRQT